MNAIPSIDRSSACHSPREQQVKPEEQGEQCRVMPQIRHDWSLLKLKDGFMSIVLLLGFVER
jgi:hypothetical protein